MLRSRLAALAGAVLLAGCAGRATDVARPPAAAPSTTSQVALTPVGVPGPAPAPVPEPIPAPGPAAPRTPLPLLSTVVPLIDEGRPLTTLVWYPDGPGPWPLLVFAHGYAVGPDPYIALCEAWAAAGYVVAAPRFPFTDASVAGDALDESDLDNQPADVVFVMQALLAADGPLPGIADPTRIGVAGHSDGGLTALSVAADPPPGLRAVMALSTSPVGRPGENPALLVVQGDEDDINGWEYGQAVYDEAAPPKFLVYLLGAGHLPPYEEGSDWETAIRRLTVSFLDRYVAGRVDDGGSLLDEGEPGVATVEGLPE